MATIEQIQQGVSELKRHSENLYRRVGVPVNTPIDLVLHHSQWSIPMTVPVKQMTTLSIPEPVQKPEPMQAPTKVHTIESIAEDDEFDRLLSELELPSHHTTVASPTPIPEPPIVVNSSPSPPQRPSPPLEMPTHTDTPFEFLRTTLQTLPTPRPDLEHKLQQLMSQYNALQSEIQSSSHVAIAPVATTDTNPDEFSSTNFAWSKDLYRCIRDFFWIT